MWPPGIGNWRRSCLHIAGSVLRNTLRNPAFLVGGLLLLGLALVALFGERLPNVDPYQIHGVMSVGGEYSAPPFKTSPEFPWGSDHIGRDIRSLVIAGAGRTLSLVLVWNAGPHAGRHDTGAAGWLAEEQLVRSTGHERDGSLGGVPSHLVCDDRDPGTRHSTGHVGVRRGDFVRGLGRSGADRARDT